HQFGAGHTQVSSSYYDRDVDLGKHTIMSQGQNLSQGSYFHGVSVLLIRSRNGFTSTCVSDVTAANTEPLIQQPGLTAEQLRVPIGTPFELEFPVTDADGDTLQYSWDPFNDAGDGHTHRYATYPPRLTPSRTFPDEQTVYAGQFRQFESYTSLGDGSHRFRLFVRDGSPAGGGMVWSDELAVEVVDNAGPFRVSSPNAGETQSGTLLVEWEVAGTDSSSINATTVDILLSTDNGETYSVLAAATPNDGSETVTLPSIVTAEARIKVAPTDRLFFAVNDGPFSIGTVPFELLHKPFEQIKFGSSGMKVHVYLNDPNSAIAANGVQLHWRLTRDSDQPFNTATMAQTPSSAWECVVPTEFDCEAEIEYFFSGATGINGELLYEPVGAPWGTFATKPRGWDTEYDMEDTTGWSVTGSATSGAWQVTIPVATPGSGTPASDWDGSGNAWVTGVGNSIDVDGGETILVSPVFPESTRFQFAYWLADSVDSPLDGGDGLAVDVYLPALQDWTNVLQLTSTSSTWRRADSKTIEELLENSVLGIGFTQIRFRAIDGNGDSKVEAAIDALQITDGFVSCTGTPCPIDFAPPYYRIDLRDLEVFIQLFGAGDLRADLAAPFGALTIDDVYAFLEAYSAGCDPRE
ncbi:MAG: GC-type dockerin domain-anchored protein, partial [Phycisphaerales bacterium JB065]